MEHMHNTRLSGPALAQALSGLQGWTLAPEPDHIAQTWTFDSFQTAMDFWAQVAALAERHDHHPECLSTYTHLRIRLWTHDAGGLTLKDVQLASDIDQLLAKDFASRLQGAARP